MIQLNNLTIGYNGKPIMEGLNYTFENRKIYGILAPSGSGKTTLLRTVAGLIKPISGSVSIDPGSDLPKDGTAFMMHQKYTNFNWLNLVNNILIAERDRNLRNKERTEKALDILRQVGLYDYRDYYPTQLSGGMNQRLALARVLYVRPSNILMDEPLSALDDDTRKEMQKLILKMQRETGSTILMVTHSKAEAETMCHHIYTPQKGGN